jgi:hypothetical protein
VSPSDALNIERFGGMQPIIASTNIELETG